LPADGGHDSKRLSIIKSVVRDRGLLIANMGREIDVDIRTLLHKTLGFFQNNGVRLHGQGEGVEVVQTFCRKGGGITFWGLLAENY